MKTAILIHITTSAVPTDTATIVEVNNVGGVEVSGAGYPASTAASVAIRSYKQTGTDGVVLDIAQRTSLFVVSQLKTF